MAKQLHAAARLPKLPDRDHVAGEEIADYDWMVERIGRGFGPTTEYVDGRPYGQPHFSAMTASPPLAAALGRLGNAVMARQDEPRSYSQADHEMIDMVLPLDSGYWGLLAGHTPAAIAGGVRVEAIEALRHGREDELTDEERERVKFIRAVRDGTVTDEVWQKTKERIGSERGVVELVYMICLLVFHLKFCQATGVPEMTEEAFDQMLAEYKDGRRQVPPTYKEMTARKS